MSNETTATLLIPPPPAVREKLAQNIREGRLLRQLLGLSIRAAEERHRQRVDTTEHAPALARG